MVCRVLSPPRSASSAMLRPQGFIVPCQSTSWAKPPLGLGWIHEIKHDGYRMMALRAGDHIHLLTRSRADWRERFPAVVKALEWLDVKSCLIDGELRRRTSLPSTFSRSTAANSLVR
jgi:bifunctional non-homologous end joining protein LigD